MEEGESLLFMSLGFHSVCYNTTLFPKHILDMEGACLQTIYPGMFHS